METQQPVSAPTPLAPVSVPTITPETFTDEASTPTAPPPPASFADKGDAEALPGAGEGEVPDWHGLLSRLAVGGMVRQLAQHCELRRFGGAEMVLRLAAQQRQLLMRASQDKLQQALAEHFGRPIRLVIEVGDVENLTPADSARQERQERQERAHAAIKQDEFVRTAADLFDASLVESSIQPL